MILPIITLDQLNVVATVSRRYATATDVALAIADLEHWRAQDNLTDPITDDEVRAVLQVRGLIGAPDLLGKSAPPVRQ